MSKAYEAVFRLSNGQIARKLVCAGNQLAVRKEIRRLFPKATFLGCREL
jgi:hypothetical protein